MKPVTTKTTMKLPVVFSQTEMDAKRDRLSAAILEYDEIEDKKKASASDYNETIKALRGELRALSTAIRARGEVRDVNCVIKFHTPENGIKSIVRTDTNELVESKPMTFEERQESLFEDEVEQLTELYTKDDVNAAPRIVDDTPDGKTASGGA